MCLIIAKQQGAIVPVESVTNGARQNNDGAGISITGKDGLVWTHKYLTTEALLQVHQKDLEDPETVAALHLRLATHGSVNIKNVHPFRIRGGGAVHHNGIFSSVQQSGDETDSEAFVRKYLDPGKPFSKYRKRRVKQNLEKLAGGSKLVIHDTEGLFIVNEELGIWDDGVWYSNTGYKEPVYRTYAFPAVHSGDYDRGYYRGVNYYNLGQRLQSLRDELPNHEPERKRKLFEQLEEFLDDCQAWDEYDDDIRGNIHHGVFYS